MQVKLARFCLLMSFTSCFISLSVPALAQEVKAIFSASETFGCGQLPVQFTDHSTGNPTEWTWDFGNGQTLTGHTETAKNPSITYTKPGTYTVTLTVTNGVSTSTDSTKINVYVRPSVSFSLDPASGCYPLNVQFTDNTIPGTGNITNWTWDFGDGSQFGTVQNPSHTYNAAGTFDVKLTVKNSAGCEASSSAKKVVTNEGVTVSFDADKTFSCQAPFLVNFTASTSSPESITYTWDFGDGTSAKGQNASHTYTGIGKYTVTLTAAVNGGGCQDQVIKQDYIYVGTNVSDFETPQGCANVPLAFKNTSLPTPVSSTWNFGDGSTSNEINPKHTYSAAGTYTVTLTNDFGGCTQSVKKSFTTYPSPKAAFKADPQKFCGVPATATFQNLSTGATSWKWKFGDGDSATQEQPEHVYKLGGTYDVMLIVTSGQGCVDTASQANYIHVDAPDIDFYASPGFGCVGYTSTFSVPDASDISSFLWDFGGGQTSNDPNPSHQFNQEGVFTVKLTVVTKQGCTFTQTKTDFIHVGKRPKVDFSTNLTTVCLDTFVQLTNLSVPNGDTWTWKFPQDNTTETKENPTHTFQNLGPQDVKLIVNNNGCVDSLTKPKYITVSPPKAGFISKLISCSDPYTFQFTDTSTGANQRTWNFGDGKTYTDQSITYTFPSVGGKKVILTVSNGTCSSSFTGYVQVAKENPVITPSASTICHGSQVTLSASKFRIAQYVKSITWNDGNGHSVSTSNISTDTNEQAFTYDDNGTYTPSLELTYITGCKEVVNAPPIKVQGPSAGFTTSQSKLCQGSSISFTGNSKTNPSDAAIKQWEWNFGDGTTTTSPTNKISHDFQQSGTFLTQLKVTDANGCSDVTTSAQDYQIEVYPSLAFFDALDTTVCPAVGVQWENKSKGNITSYQWNFGDGTGSTDAVPQKSYGTDGQYTVSLKIATDKGCADSMQRNNYITVGTPLAVMKNPDDVKICRILKDTAISLSKNYNDILWDFGDGTTSTTDTSYHIYNIPGTYIQKLTVHGYSDGCQAEVQKQVIIAGPIGTPVLTNAAGCTPLKVNFSAKNVERAVTYQWFFGNGAASPELSSAQTTYTYQQAGLFHPTLKLTDDTGCYVIVPILDTLSVVADSLGMEPGYSWPEVCDSNKVLFNAAGTIFSVDSLGKTADYFWDFGDPSDRANGVSNEKSPTYRYPKAGIYNALLKITTAYGCTQSVPFEVNIPDSVALAVQAAADPLSICKGNSIQLKATSNIGESYVWTPAADLDNPEIANPIAIPSANTTYQVIAYSNGNCQSDTAEVNVVVHDLPQVDAGPDIIASTGSVVQLVAKGSTDVVQWSWAPPDYLSCTSCAAPTSTPLQNMLYTVTAANGFGCKSSDSVKINLICDKGKVFIPNTFSPNGDGNNDVFYPRGLGVKNIVYFRIYNRFGQLVYERTDFQLNEISAGWDGTFKGKKVDPGVFVYVTSMICDNNEVFQLTGNVTLLR